MIQAWAEPLLRERDGVEVVRFPIRDGYVVEVEADMYGDEYGAWLWLSLYEEGRDGPLASARVHVSSVESRVTIEAAASGFVEGWDRGGVSEAVEALDREIRIADEDGSISDRKQLRRVRDRFLSTAATEGNGEK